MQTDAAFADSFRLNHVSNVFNWQHVHLASALVFGRQRFERMRAPVGTSAARFASIMSSFVAVKIFNSRVSTFGRDSGATGVIGSLSNPK